MFSPGWHQATHIGLGVDGDEEQVLVAVATLVVGQHLMRVWPLVKGLLLSHFLLMCPSVPPALHFITRS
jgi:hypothetical protein